MATLLTFTWSASSNPALAATAADRVLKLTPGAGVTGRVALQVTNNTDADLLVNDSGVPPADAAGAKFVIPPRCTATHPLDAAGQVSFRWSGVVLGSADYVDLVFTDDHLTSAVWPGVIPSSGSSSPVQTFTRSGVPPTVADTITTITTDSGRNIGNLFIYNNTATHVYVTGAGTIVQTVRPYSYVTFPINKASGSITVEHQNTWLWSLLDSLFVAWADINYVGPFPAGAGKLPNATIEGSGQQIVNSSGAGGAFTVALYTLAAWGGAGTHANTICLQSLSVGGDGGAAPWAMVIEATTGLDGLSPNLQLCSTGSVAGQSSQLVFTYPNPIVIKNLSQATPNVIQVRSVGPPTRGDWSIAGWVL